MTLVLHYAARSDRGLVRSNNQDSVYAGPRLLALADGMGGHAAGEVASKVVIAALAPLDDDEPGDDLLGHLHDAMVSGNSAISELVASDPDLDGMGTTLTAVLFAGSKLGLVHIGDSRAYQVRDGDLSLITHDDTFVQSLIDEGRITEEEAANHPQRSLLLRALTGHDVEPSLAVREARSGDRYLLCSDGLSSVVSEETIAEALRISDPQQCADRMIELALKGGGPDNVTVIVADVVDVEFGEDAPIVAGAAGADGEDQPQPDSAAARASAATRPQPQRQQPEQATPPPEDPPPRRRWLRSLLITGAVLAVLAGLVFAGRWWVFNQYFIGVNKANEVVIFQGVQGSMLGLSLHRQVEGSCPASASPGCQPISVNDLQEAQRPDVRNGITELQGLQGAREAMLRLRMTALLPACDESGPAATQSPTDKTTASTAPPPTRQGGTAQNTPARNGSESTSKPTPSPTGTPLQPQTQTPGVTCRTVS
ncbi:protein phosphatase [Halopolyspora algeriensis]|uniref:Serine/threonine protein phosphatase PstP n=1 Tax=Halopolyspora algeriensis TaxID=1500506 RepID=A0A368VYH0_9ACTN|nr:PP2C family serine/threonine-protein phosphatase [Halopolyspora algeriensis]RCW47258.1 protein phosphatase [Halopolyspora algeriensis]TQM42494.1 protein phosphatase [Halopolyspora algeriensis]